MRAWLPISAGLILSSTAFAGPGGSAEPYTSEGLEFNEPLIHQCMELARDGQVATAIGQLNQAIRSNSGGRSEKVGELKLGLAMVYLRTHQKAKALGMLKPLAEKDNCGSISSKAALLMRAAKFLPNSGKEERDWVSEKGWNSVLRDVRQDLAQVLEHEHKTIHEAIRARRWADVARHLEGARQQVALDQLIKLSEPEARPADLLRRHLAGLRSEVFQFNSVLASMVAEADAIRAEPGQREYVGRRGNNHRKVIQDPQTRAQFDEQWNEIERTAELGRELASEYHRLYSEEDTERTFDQRVAIRVPGRRPWRP